VALTSPDHPDYLCVGYTQRSARTLQRQFGCDCRHIVRGRLSVSAPYSENRPTSIARSAAAASGAKRGDESSTRARQRQQDPNGP
jgi:hypothetical protein